MVYSYEVTYAFSLKLLADLVMLVDPYGIMAYTYEVVHLSRGLPVVNVDLVTLVNLYGTTRRHC